MKELIDLRKPREKHFLNSDGTFTVQMYDHDIHYLKNGKYEEIDNRLEETETFIYNKHNSYHAYFFKENLEELMRLEKDSDFLSFSLVRSKACHILTNSKFVIYQNILKNIDIEYKFVRNKIKDSIIINSIDNNFSDFAFVIKTNLDLNLENNTIWILKDGKKINQMEPPTLMDKNKNFYFIQYELEKRESDYILTFSFDKELLNQENLYPFVIDPTLVNNDKKAVYDTYIYAGDEGVNRNDTDILKVGVDENGKIYRTLVKFDLPTIGTGCEVVNAVATLVSHASEFVVQNSQYEHKRFFAHEITSAWDESTASWNNMHDKYNERVEDCFIAYKTEIFGYDYFLKTTSIDVTNLVKRWYAGAANNGLLVKLEEEVKSEHSYYPFYSKNNNISEGNEGADDPKPYLIVTYRNFNGLEDYMTYQEISHQEGSSYVNHLTGNLTNVFEANKTVGGKYPIALNLVYNSNDVVLETDVGLGIGYRFNFLQTIKEVTISDNPYLEYVDGDGTIHYFYKEDDTTYLDEDGLNLKATFASEKWTIQDKSNNQSIFQKSGDTYYLNKLIDSYQNEVVITYDSSNRIQSVTDANNETITISYEENKITTTSNYQTSILNKTNQKIISLVTRQGTTSFAYNSYGLVSKITDTDGLATEFSYYDASPYRMKKITEKGLSGTEGNTLEFIYSFLVTRVMDGKGRCNTYVFNEQGNTINTTSLKNPTDFRNGYGVENIYDSNTNNTKNKLSLNIPTMKYVKNYFIDPSFESKNIGFIYDNAQVTNTNVHSGNKCVVTNYQIQIPLPILETSGYYTFSGYFKNSSSMELSIRTSSSNVTDVQYYYFSDEYKRRIITAYLEAGTQYYLNVFPVNSATIYMDDFQLEEGNVASYLNLVENSDFSNGMSTWESSVFNMTGEDIINDDTIVTLDNGQKAYQMNCKPSLSKILSKQISVKGKKGDAYRLSFWYKNEGLGTGTIASGNIAVLTFGYTSDVPHGTPTYGLNSHATEWQYFERIIVAEEDYESFSLSIMAQFNVNKLYFTNLYLVKDLGGNSFEYDEEGNLISATDTSNSTSIFQYDANNQLVSNFSPKGNSFKFEYDNTDSQKLLQGVSSKGIANQIEYDENQNPINTIIKSVKTLDDFTQEYFYIRKKSTEDYLFADFEGNIPKLRPFECNLSRFLLERVHDEDRNVDYYYIKTDIVERYFAYRDNISEKVVLVENKNDASLFELISNKNGSYTLRIKKVYETDSEELVYDACIAFNDSNALIIENYEIDNPDQELFFESAVTPLYAETKAEYQSNGKFISKTIDALGKVTTYDINPVTGLTTSVKEPNGTVTSYEYNDKEQVTKITKNEKEILYAYNSQNLLDKITSNNKEYKFVYDDFLNQKQVKLGDTVFVTNHYENNNGNLASINYGNNTSVSYTYDDLDRLKTMTKSNHVYTYDYDNLNHLSKVKSTEETYEYLYDFAGRIVEYLYNQTDNFLQKSRVQYEYDINNNVTKKTVNNTLNNFITEYVYDEDDNIIKVTFDNISLNYQRDYLGRLVSKNINDQIPVEYTYYTNGNKTSFVLKSMKIDDELYEYYYDDVYNLSKVFKVEK